MAEFLPAGTNSQNEEDAQTAAFEHNKELFDGLSNVLADALSFLVFLGGRVAALVVGQ